LKLYPRYYPHPDARHVAKFHEVTPPGFKVLAANTLHFKPILDPPLKKIVRGTAVSGGECASKTWSFSSAYKNFGAQHPVGAEIWSFKKFDLGGYDLTG